MNIKELREKAIKRYKTVNLLKISIRALGKVKAGSLNG